MYCSCLIRAVGFVCKQYANPHAVSMRAPPGAINYATKPACRRRVFAAVAARWAVAAVPGNRYRSGPLGGTSLRVLAGREGGAGEGTYAGRLDSTAYFQHLR